MTDRETYQYKITNTEWLVPVYRSQPDPEKQGYYRPLEVVALASISNSLEPLERIFFVSCSLKEEAPFHLF